MSRTVKVLISWFLWSQAMVVVVVNDSAIKAMHDVLEANIIIVMVVWALLNIGYSLGVDKEFKDL